MRMLDLFCGRGGWTNAFLVRVWDVTGVDIVQNADYRGEFIPADVLAVTPKLLCQFDFICASPPCQEFSKFGMPNFYPEPPYPERGIALFNHTRAICWQAGVPWIIENVWGAQQFVGMATHKCGPYHLWGTGVPPLLPQGIIKGGRLGTGGWQHTGSKNKQQNAAEVATIPPELANCAADYAERLIADGQTQRDSQAEPRATAGRDPVNPRQRAISIEGKNL